MSILTGKGKEVADKFNKPAEENKIDFKKVKINKDLKKENDSVRVRLLGAEDFSTYEAHGHYGKGIWTAPCIHVAGERCLFCEASKFEGWEELAGKTRFLFAFYDIDAAMVRYLECSFGQGKSLMGNISDYEDSIQDVAFTLKRVGSGTKTAYTLSPILKLKGNDQNLFDAGAEEKVADDFFEKVLYVKNTNQMAKDLKEAGFDVEGLLGYTIVEENKEEGQEKPVNGDADPSKVF
jgi:hypothetical protein